MESPNLIRIASFDIGTKNFAFCIEEINKNTLENITNIPKVERYNIDGTLTEKFKEIINIVCNNGKIVLFKNNDLSKGLECTSTKTTFNHECFYKLTELLDSYVDEWNKCDIFLIEQQMSFGKKYNTIALKLGQHTYSYFMIKYCKEKKIVEYPSYHKTQILGAPKIEHKTKKGTYKSMEKPARKKWSIQFVMELLKTRGEIEILSQLTSQKKKDDIADTLTQLQSFKYLFLVDGKN